jgi:hypothetical protein
VRAKLVTDVEGRFYGVRINCPGCGDKHIVTAPAPAGYTESPHYANSPRWTWNGDLERPTFSPSLLVTSGHYAKGRETPDPAGCYCNADEDFGPWACYRCHSFIREGRIQFLSDCTHALAGQTADLPEIECFP